MASEEWYTPAAETSGMATNGAAPPPIYELRPLTLGEVLDRTFAIYRSRFLLFAGIASLSAVVQTLMNAIQMIAQHGLIRRPDPTNPFGQSAGALMTGLLVALVTFLAFSVTQAATVFALSEVYLGRTTTIEASLRATIGRALRYMGIAIWQMFSAGWVMLVVLVPAFMLVATRVTGLMALGGFLMFAGIFGGFAVGVILYLRNALAVPASVVEELPVRASMRRSKDLAVGTKGRIFMVLLIAGVLYMAVGVLEAPLSFMILQAVMRGTQAIGAQIGLLAINFVCYSLVGPVAMIGLSLLYFDQRVRKEAFDLAVLLGEDAGLAESVSVAEIAAPVEAEAAVAEAAVVPTEIVAASEEAPVVAPEAEAEAGRADDATEL